MTITGENFGPNFIPITALINNVNCTKTIRFDANTLLCTIPQGAGASLPVQVALYVPNGVVLSAAASDGFSYNPPVISIFFLMKLIIF